MTRAYSQAHTSAFNVYRAKGYDLAAMTTDQLRALEEDPTFKKAIDRWLQKRERQTKTTTPPAAPAPLLRSDLPALAKPIADSIKSVTTPLHDRIVQLESELAGLKQQIAGRGALLSAKGTWTPLTRYVAGDVTIRDGSSWVATTNEPRSAPGDKSSGEWILLASRGQPGKDAR